MNRISKKIISLMLALIMAMPAVLAVPFSTEAQDVPGSAYWSILASTDFTSTTWSGSGDSYSTSSSPRTSKGGNGIGWNVKYGTHSSNEVLVDSNGVNFDWVTDNQRHQGLMYMSSYNGQTSNTIFNGIDNFKIDLAFSFTGRAKCNTGYNLDGERNDVPLIKLANDSSNKYNHRSQYNHQSNYFIQTMWGKRSINSTDYYVDGETGSNTTGGKWAITTSDNNASSVLAANTTYHYVVYVADNMLGCYVADDSGNLLINYNPIEIASFNLSPSVISSIYLGASEFNWAGKYDVENIAYKSIEIYKGVSTSSYDSSRDKFLYAYFTGDSDAGETMHYAISQDGINFEAVSGGTKVWNPSINGATETYPATDSAPYSDSVAISNHVRDSYAFYGQDGKDYVIATDLNTNNGNWGNIQNSRFLVWKMDYFGDINDTRPWTIDTANLPGMDEITGATSSSHKTVKKAWAPQVIWDADKGKYMLYWSVGADGITTQIYYTYTSDFKTDFTTVKRLLYPDFDGGNINAHIDADITYHNGLYYCYFKNEDGSGTGSKRIWYAVAPNANGPYTDYELINTSYGAEGPQVYETGNGSYMLMIDGYGDHTYHMYSAGSPYSFNTSNETATNVTSLSPRHGSIIRITDAEYQKLKKLRIGEELRYAWETTGNYGHNSVQTDSTGNQYHVTWNQNASTTTTGSGALNITESGMYTDLSTVQNFIASDVYTVTFYYKSSGSTARDDNHSIFSISRSDEVSNYVRLSTNGKFYVNNAVVTPSGNCSDGTTTRAAKFASAVADTSNSHRYTVTSDGLITSLIIDGEYICGVINDTDIPNTLWITFGWARMANYENNRLTAQFGQIVFKNVATETGKIDEFFSSLSSNLNVTPKTFTGTAAIWVAVPESSTLAVYTGDNTYFNNVVYAKTGVQSIQLDRDWNSSYLSFVAPQDTVLAYDGTNQPSMPVSVGYKKKSGNYGMYYAYITDGPFEVKGNWRGYYDYGDDYTLKKTNSQLSYVYTTTNTTGNQSNTNKQRFWANKAFYTGSGAGKNDHYLESVSIKISATSTRNNGYNNVCQSDALGTNYIINYKPIRDILAGTTKIPGSDLTASQLIGLTETWKYTADSYVDALYKLQKVCEVNPNDTSKYNYSGDTGAAALQCGKDIEAALEAFNSISLVKRSFNITYRMADGSTKAEIVTAGNNLANVPPQTTAFHITDTNTHKKNCSWTAVSHEAVPSGSSAYNPSVTPSTSVMPKASTIYTETAATTETCEIAHVAANGDVNGYNRYECSICGETNDDYRMWDSQTWTTYNTNYTEYEGIVGDPDYATTYTTTSKNTYETTVANNTLNTEDKSISQSRINTNAGNILNAKGGLEALADLTYFDAEFDKANTFLVNLDGKTAEYTAASVQALVNAVTAAGNVGGANKSVQQIANANAVARADFGQAVQTDATTFANNIKTAMDGLQKVETIAPTVDTTAFNEAVSILNNIDPDVYDVTKGDVESIRASANAPISSDETQIEYRTATINVLNNSITQQNINDATRAIVNALTVRTKTYTITKSNEGSTDFTVSTRNGTSYGSGDSAEYGTTIIASTNDDSEVAWYLEIQTGSMHKNLAFQSYGKRLTTKVLGNTTIKAVKNTGAQKKVTIYRTYDTKTVTDKSPIEVVDYVDSGANFTLPTAPAIALYGFDKYYIANNEGYDEYVAGNSVTINNDTVIIAKYDATPSADCAINATGGSEAYSRTVAYNTKVSLTGAANTYGWVEAIDATHYRPFKIGKDVEFYASESTTLMAVDQTAFNAYKFSFPCVNLRQSGIIESDGKKVFNAQLVNDGKDIQEYGILIAAPLTKAGSTPISMDNLLPSMVVIENSGKHEGENAYQILRAKSTKLVGASQFSISVSSLPSQYIYRGYAIYKDANGNLQTAYSEAMR